TCAPGSVPEPRTPSWSVQSPAGSDDPASPSYNQPFVASDACNVSKSFGTSLAPPERSPTVTGLVGENVVASPSKVTPGSRPSVLDDVGAGSEATSVAGPAGPGMRRSYPAVAHGCVDPRHDWVRRRSWGYSRVGSIVYGSENAESSSVTDS